MSSEQPRTEGVTTNDVRDRITEVFADVLDQPDLQLTDETVAKDVPGWDSLMHVSLMFSVEQEFGITFSDKEMGELSDVGALVRLVEQKAA
ncbi:MAG: acyl carrier protein [Micrococcales bacterium]|nr:MAG: acyl carrier protein [Micrococcales bacterium]PIE27863.1 MAG: acyl carrier protein [Micrococcales bacterium]